MDAVFGILDGMSTLFVKIMNMSITASYVILAVLLVRWCIRLLFPEVPKKYSYLLWIVVAFRLICPWSFDSQWSLFQWELFDMTQVQQVGSGELEYIPSDITTSKDAQISLGLSGAQDALQNVENDLLGSESSVVPQSPPYAAVGSELTRTRWLWIATVTWSVGMIGLVGYGIISYLRMQRRMEKAILLRDDIYQSEWVRTPFILGFARPRIYIPFHLKEEDLHYVLAHEQTHLKRRDHLVKPFACLLLAVHWFNPLVWVAFAEMSRDMELSCDEVVLAQGENIRKAYSETLLYLSVHHKPFSYSPLAFGETSVKTRIKNALAWKNPKLATTIGAGIVCILVVILCAANPRKPTPEEGIIGKYYANPDNVMDSLVYYTKDDILGVNLILYITEEGELLLERRDSLLDQDPVEWIHAGVLEECQLTRDNFNDYFYYNGGSRPGHWFDNEDNPLVPNRQASYYRHNNWKAWRTIVDSRMIYLLQQRDGEIYIAYGYYDSEGETDPYSDDSEFYFFKRLTERTTEELTRWGVILVDDYGREKIVPWDPEEEIRQAIENEEMESDAKQETTPEQQTEYRAPEYDNKLDQAIHQAILDHFRREDSKNHFATASHVILDTEYRETSSLQDVLDGQKKYQYVVYAVTSYHEWVAEKEILSGQWTDDDPAKMTFGKWVAEKEILSWRWTDGGPAKMTFDVMSDGTFQLMGYWEPRGGEEYGNDLKYMFSSEAMEKLYDVELGKGMNYSLRRIQICYEQAVHGLGLDGEAIVAGMLDEIMATADEYLSTPSSEDPNWGQWLQHIDSLLFDMSDYGNYTLSYLYKEFLKGGQTDLRGEVMRIAMVRTDAYQRAIDYDAVNGQEYFDAWLEHEREQMEKMGADYMKQRCYSSWLALKLAGLIE